MTGAANRPKILRGAFVELAEPGTSIPPLFVVFQFNPVELTRRRALTFGAPRGLQPGDSAGALRRYHQREADLIAVRDRQDVTVAEEQIAFDIRLDATDELDAGDTLAEQHGIGPRLAALELMVQPKEEGVLGQALGALLGSPGGFSFTKRPSPPMVLFVWGRKRVLPVNVNALDIVEAEHSATLDPVRATVAVELTVIEGRSLPQLATGAMREALAAMNLAHIGEIADVVVPS
jgi:hypothetical protein